MVLELDRVEDPDAEEDLDWIIRLHQMSAEQSAICMDWWALPNLRAQPGCEGGQEVGDSRMAD
eukprot:2168471-Prymnesium_polylepis.1